MRIIIEQTMPGLEHNRASAESEGAETWEEVKRLFCQCAVGLGFGPRTVFPELNDEAEKLRRQIKEMQAKSELQEFFDQKQLDGLSKQMDAMKRDITAMTALCNDQQAVIEALKKQTKTQKKGPRATRKN